MTLLDLQFQGVSGVIACYVLESSDGPILVDPGPDSTYERLRAGLSELGHDLADVRHVLLTHIHLDHAGAAGRLAEESGATVYVHARGVAHLARPKRLLASAAQIYGDQMKPLWGETRPVPEEQLRALDGGEVLKLGGLELEALYTPGHAVHHLAWRQGGDLYCGDVGGVRLEPVQSPRAPTPPPDIKLETWRDSVQRLRALDVNRLRLTHFGSYTDVQAHWDALLGNMARDAERIRIGLVQGMTPEVLAGAFSKAVERDLNAEDPTLAARMRFASPAWMSAQGLTRYWTKRGLGTGGPR